jgi:hypothetical protein
VVSKVPVVLQEVQEVSFILHIPLHTWKNSLLRPYPQCSLILHHYHFHLLPITFATSLPQQRYTKVLLTNSGLAGLGKGTGGAGGLAGLGKGTGGAGGLGGLGKGPGGAGGLPKMGGSPKSSGGAEGAGSASGSASSGAEKMDGM